MDAGNRLTTLTVATSEHGNAELPGSLVPLLRALRQQFGMDIVFVSRFADRRRTIVAVDAAPGHEEIRPGMSDPIEQSWCHHIVQGRLPELIRDGRVLVASGRAPATSFDIGTHLSVPVVLPDGTVYGTLCTIAFRVHPSVSTTDLASMRIAASVIASRLSTSA